MCSVSPLNNPLRFLDLASLLLSLVVPLLGQPAKKAIIQVTKPVDFHFCTEERIKQHTESQPGNEYKEVNFVSGLRKHPPSPVRGEGNKGAA